MNRTTQENGVFQGKGWLAGGASTLLIIGAGLELFAQHADEQVSVAAMLLALYLSFWSYVLGIGGLLFFSACWLVEWRREQAKRSAVSRPSPGPVTWQSELESPQFLQQAVAPAGSRQLSKKDRIRLMKEERLSSELRLGSNVRLRGGSLRRELW